MEWKLGAHINGPPTPEALYAAAHSKVVLQMDGVGALAVAPPGALCIARKSYTRPGEQAYGPDARATGRRVARETIDSLGGFRRPGLAIMGYCEYGTYLDPRMDGTHGPEGFEATIEFTAGMVEVASPEGIDVVGGNHGVGCPEQAEMRYAAEHNWGGARYWGLHGYEPFSSEVCDWHGARHRKFLAATGGRRPPGGFVYTETGIDVVEGKGWPGWANPKNGINLEQFQSWCVLYNAKALQDPEVVGGVIFTFAPFSQWAYFNADALARKDSAGRIWWPGWTPTGQKSQPPAEESQPVSSKPLWIALIGSNQDTNPVLAGTNEMQQVAPLVQAMRAAFARQDCVEVGVFTPPPESQDYPRGSYSGLKAVQARASSWFKEAPAGTLCVALNVHTDSGSTPHVGDYYDGRNDVSKRLAHALGLRLQALFGPGCALYEQDYRGYIFVTDLVGGCPILIEAGSHSVLSQVKLVADHADDIAEGVCQTTMSFFSLPYVAPAVIEPNWEELRRYSTWAGLRIDRRESPIDLEAFRAHLAGTNSDASDPGRYGWPG